jgi:uncharacterized repeat protein (TIGR01451 family)
MLLVVLLCTCLAAQAAPLGEQGRVRSGSAPLAPPLPDLIITDLWPVGNTIHYQLWNAGAATAAPGHATGLTIDGFSFPGDTLSVALAPGERVSRYFPPYGWSCSAISDTIRACADAVDVVWESDEGNNCREETVVCDPTPPAIVDGPRVEVLGALADVSWETDEDCQGTVRYGPRAGVFAGQISELGSGQAHDLSLPPLQPATVYHYVVECADAGGNTVTSADGFFRTDPPPPKDPPELGQATVTRDEGPAVRYTISVPVSDTAGVDRVECYFDGELIGIDYSPDPIIKTGINAPPSGIYSCSLDPEDEELSRTAFFSNTHALATRAFNTTGLSVLDTMGYVPDYELPDIQLTVWPRVEQYRYVAAAGDLLPPDATISLNVEAYEREWWIDWWTMHEEERQLTVDRVTFSIDGTTVHTWYPGTDEFEHHHDLDIGGLGVGDYDVRVTAHGATGGATAREFGLHIEVGVPSLEVSREVTRLGNAFQVQLTLENWGTGAADVSRLRDWVTGFQPVVSVTEDYSVTADYNTAGKYAQVDIDVFTTTQEYLSLGAGESMVIEYAAVPVLHEEFETFEYAMGAPHDVWVWERESGADRLRWTLEAPGEVVADGDLLAEAVGRARAEADYLIVTYPLYLNVHAGTAAQVELLLSKIAELAQLKNGVLGYLSDVRVDNAWGIRDHIIEWGDGMTGSYGVAGNYLATGNLLLVGETEIIASWWSDGYGWRGDVSYVDNSYADISSDDDEENPELVVGRIIGDTVDDLLVPIQTSIDVHRGDGPVYFDKRSALLVSGAGDGVEEFEESVDDADWDLGAVGSAFDEVDVVKRREVEDLGLDVLNVFTTTIISTAIYPQGRDLILYRDHCDEYGWSHVIDDGDFPISTAEKAPVVLGVCCLSGRYEGLARPGIAAQFLRHGAGVYIGATEITYTDPNNEATNFFFERWPRSDESVGQSFRAIKWHMDRRDGRFWSATFNLYGDPKLDLTAAALTALATASPAALPAATGPITTVDVVIPDLVVTGTLAGGHHVRIPGGGMLLEPGKPQVPDYLVQIDYAPGERVQDVVLTSRSGLMITSGLVISTAGFGIDPAAVVGPAAPEAGAEWWPELDRDFEWWLRDHPDGSSTLVIHIMPFYYNALTLEALFYRNYSFEIERAHSEASIDRLGIDRYEVAQGATVAVELDVSNTGVPTDVIVNAVIKDDGTGQVVDGLLLRALTGLAGQASFSSQWNTYGFDPGYYVVHAQLVDGEGRVLDSETERFRVGIWAGKVVSATASHTTFLPGEPVHYTMVFSNTGTVPISGTAEIKVRDSQGANVETFIEPLGELAPGNDVTVAVDWQTAGVAPGVYRLLGFVHYNGATVAAEPLAISTPQLFLPVVMRGHW